MTGAFQHCELDQETDDLYAITFFYNSAARFIYKESLGGDKWELMSTEVY